MQKKLSVFITLIMLLSSAQAFAATSASQTVTATLTRPTGGGGGGGGGGAAVGAGIGGGAAAAAAGAYAFAPLLLAGLTPNSVIFAAAPIGCVPCVQNYLQAAAMNHFCVKTYAEAAPRLAACSDCRFFFVQNNSEIINGTYDLHPLALPKELQSACKIRVKVTIASDPYKEVYNEPELSFGIYKDLSQSGLSKKFETQQFMHHYLMSKYEIPLTITNKSYSLGLQKLSGTIDMTKVVNRHAPMQVAVRYTQGGFKKNQKIANPKTLVYAYVIELEKIK